MSKATSKKSTPRTAASDDTPAPDGAAATADAAARDAPSGDVTEDAAPGQGVSIVPADAGVPDGVAQLVALYRETLGDVSFPDVSLAVLESATAELHACTEALLAARAAVAEAELAVTASRTALSKLAERALAYAQIYASDDAALKAQLEAISLEDSKSRARRGRPVGSKSKTRADAAVATA
jgi:hypothetical protein